jgi:hypothetical protein
MRDNTQREGNGRLAYGNQIYKRNMPTSSDMGDSRLKVKLRRGVTPTARANGLG